MDIFTLNLMSTFNQREFFQWPDWASCCSYCIFQQSIRFWLFQSYPTGQAQPGSPFLPVF